MSSSATFAHNLKQTTSPSVSPTQDLLDIMRQELGQLNQVVVEKLSSRVNEIQDISKYLILAGGKRIRPLLTLATARILSGDMTRAIDLGACVELIHTATLLHDDVVDHGDERRGQNTANKVWGNSAAVLTGDFLFSRAFELMVDDGSLPVLKVLSNASSTIAEGEVQQLFALNNLSLSQEESLQVIESKTASLFGAATQVGALVSHASPEQEDAARRFGHYFGTGFQLVDDILDYDPHSQTGKTQGNDFFEGKVTHPVIFAYDTEDGEEKAFWERTIGRGEASSEDFAKAQHYMLTSKSLEKCKALAQVYANQAHGALLQLPPHPVRHILEEITLYLVSRLH